MSEGEANLQEATEEMNLACILLGNVLDISY